MPHEPLTLALLALLVLLSAILYSSVGHAGASAYLAVMALMGVQPGVIRPAALVMNILVAIAGTWRFASAGLVPWRLLAPLAAGSIPAGFVGGMMVRPTHAHRLVLGVVLALAGLRLIWPGDPRATLRPPAPWPWLVLIGMALGLVAGLTGVGGGIFLSPLLVLSGWEEIRRTAGASAAFILANSIAGLLGQVLGGHPVPAQAALLAPVALAGGLYGSWLGARRLPSNTLRRLLGLVLLVAAAKLLAG
jgi:uncharacterized membrane protein YfcA